MNLLKMDFYEAAKYTLSECEAIRQYYAEDDINLENLESKSGPEIYDVATAGIGIVIDRNGLLASGEEAFRALSTHERAQVGERVFSGDKGRYVVPAGKNATKMLTDLFEGLDFAEKLSNLNQDEEDMYT